jgi:hypothetical protein
MFESRLFFVDKLIGMGARIVLCDPHRAVVVGPSRLRGAQVESPDIRAGMAMLLAALCAEGESVIDNVGQIERGYERIDERLRALGAKVERVDGRVDGTVSRTAIVRYDAYENSGGHQSASVALLDASRSGVVLSAIQGRDYARIYVKEVDRGRASIALSPEEQEAVDRAMAS